MRVASLGAGHRPWLLLLPLLAVGCILRPESSEARRQAFDRSGLEAYLLDAPPPGLHGGALFADGVRFLGMRYTPQEPGPSDRIEVEFYYRVEEPPPMENWMIFVHADPEDGGHRVIRDHEPVGGRYPTHVWRPGEVIRDVFVLPSFGRVVDVDLWTGFFRGNERMPVVRSLGSRHDGQNRILAGTIHIR
ncbi:MAG: hypothetical protein D6729_02240 [Deltaproteobacteria bacterium]|nr:MAG: hypothetical protein D6729_02240 [Deltaproteobacteria bacterium]